MGKKIDYSKKFEEISKQCRFDKLKTSEKEFIKDIAFKNRFTLQELREVVDIAIDLDMWQEGSVREIWTQNSTENIKIAKKRSIEDLKSKWLKLKNLPKRYHNFVSLSKKPTAPKSEMIKKDTLGLGDCPVASKRTRCCNLYTLDAVESCAFDCSYCTIQTFYNQNKIVFDTAFKEKLQSLRLDQDKFYHIGTGQSSDSLLQGNRAGVLDALVQFAKKNKNVILELKTKSNNISYLLKNDIPKNIICTWSLNPQIIIDNEEHLTASLKDRLQAAREVANKGILVGFHFHPMIYFEDYKSYYKDVFDDLLERFKTDEVILVSLGTLTFIKPVINQIRDRKFSSKILQMPLEDSDGKLSYPRNIKIEMFKFAYESLKAWHKKVYFYMCMENHSLWKDVFGFEYSDNEEFERDMIRSYLTKIDLNLSKD